VEAGPLSTVETQTEIVSQFNLSDVWQAAQMFSLPERFRIAWRLLLMK